MVQRKGHLITVFSLALENNDVTINESASLKSIVIWFSLTEIVVSLRTSKSNVRDTSFKCSD